MNLRFIDLEDSLANPEENTNDNKVGEENLFFYDRTMKRWEFRYCYWKSSQSFVFTRGWNRFVKEKGLKANDTIAFFHCECQDKSRGGNSFYVIDVGHDTEISGVAEVSEDEVIAKVDDNLDLCLRLGQSSNFESGQQVKERLDEHKFCSELEPAGDRKKRTGVAIKIPRWDPEENTNDTKVGEEHLFSYDRTMKR